MTNKAILSAANVLLTVFNDDKSSKEEKYEIVNFIHEMCVVADDCIIGDQTQAFHKEHILNVIEEANSVLD